jgi:hypothetical protein
MRATAIAASVGSPRNGRAATTMGRVLRVGGVVVLGLCVAAWVALAFLATK